MSLSPSRHTSDQQPETGSLEPNVSNSRLEDQVTVVPQAGILRHGDDFPFLVVIHTRNESANTLPHLNGSDNGRCRFVYATLSPDPSSHIATASQAVNTRSESWPSPNDDDTLEFVLPIRAEPAGHYILRIFLLLVYPGDTYGPDFTRILDSKQFAVHIISAPQGAIDEPGFEAALTPPATLGTLEILGRATEIPVIILAFETSLEDLKAINRDGYNYLQDHLISSLETWVPAPFLEDDLEGRLCTILALHAAAFSEPYPRGLSEDDQSTVVDLIKPQLSFLQHFVIEACGFYDPWFWKEFEPGWAQDLDSFGSTIADTVWTNTQSGRPY